MVNCHLLCCSTSHHLLAVLDKVAVDDKIPMILSVANLCNNSCARFVSKCIVIVIRSDLDNVITSVARLVVALYVLLLSFMSFCYHTNGCSCKAFVPQCSCSGPFVPLMSVHHESI